MEWLDQKEDETFRYSVDLPLSVYSAMKLAAKKRKIPSRALVVEALKQYL